jgi:endonuclease III related protein
LRRLIQPSGFYTRKAPALKAFVTNARQGVWRIARASCRPADRGLAAAVAGFAGRRPETADAILLYALGHAVPVADEYLRRIAERHGLLENAPDRARISYDELTDLTRRAFAGDAKENQGRLYNEFHALTVAVGKAHCGRTARCENCPLAET